MKKFSGNKKSILYGIGFLFFITAVNAQEPATARHFFDRKDFVAAKESIDSFVSIYNTSAGGWLLKARVYNEISKDGHLKDLVADGRADAFAALQKAGQLDRGYLNEQLMPDTFHLPYEIYSGLTDEGLAYYNAGVERNDKTSFAMALDKFKKAKRVSEFIYSSGWGLSATDTSNLYYLAKAAINAGNEEDALLFTRKIADAGITTSYAGTAFEGIYQWLVFFYKKNNQGDNVVKYAHLGMAKFPESVYFDLILVDWQRQQHNYNQLFAAYNQLFNKQPGNPVYKLAYCNDLFNFLFNSKTEISYRPAYEEKLEQELLQYLKHEPASVEARLLLAKLFINQSNQQAKEAALRSTNNAAVISGYKAAQLRLLKRSNQYLKEITTKICHANNKNCKQAQALMKENQQYISVIQQNKATK